MRPDEIAHSYDALASTWQERMRGSTYGVASFQRALRFVAPHGRALDVGCGSNMRLIDLLVAEGLEIEGIDVSEKMIALARQLRPEISFQQADICAWTPPHPYDFIAAWDSIWHLPLAAQEPVMRKLGSALKPGGVFIFTAVGLDGPAETTDSNMGVPVHYSTLGVPGLLTFLGELDCVCRHLEYDQFPEKHLVLIVQRAAHGRVPAALLPEPS